jgi:osmoprotectant transport system permease protein
MALTRYLEFFNGRINEIITLTIQHIQLSIIALIFAVVIGVPLGILIVRIPSISGFIINIANAVQAIPSLALLGFLVPLLGIGSVPSIVMIIIYSLLPIIKNTYTGLINVNSSIIEAGRGMGMTEMQIMFKVQLPLSLPFIMAGIRIAGVTAVGLTTLAALIGAGGLGQMIYRGISMVNNEMIISGAIPAMILALLIDYILFWLEKIVTPNGIK